MGGDGGAGGGGGRFLFPSREIWFVFLFSKKSWHLKSTSSKRIYCAAQNKNLYTSAFVKGGGKFPIGVLRGPGCGSPPAILSYQKNAECTFNPKYNFKKLHTLTVTPDILKLLLRGRIIFQVPPPLAVLWWVWVSMWVFRKCVRCLFLCGRV